ncbi:secondary thiamine-phosphate synthase enzyme YjbQ [bacterium]|nr:secondary thiamine-phosphate synthase enzyme YjbQ [bacterium]
MITDSITLITTKPLQLMDITEAVSQKIKELNITNGLLVVASHHTTAGIKINEQCDALERDFYAWAEKLAPSKANYEHNKVAVDDRPNAHSHLLSFLINTSETIIVKNGKMELGTWQRLFFIELDGPREKRTVNLTVLI